MKIYFGGKSVSFLFPKASFFIMFGFCDKFANFYIGKNQSGGNTLQVIFLWMIFEVAGIKK